MNSAPKEKGWLLENNLYIILVPIIVVSLVHAIFLYSLYSNNGSYVGTCFSYHGLGQNPDIFHFYSIDTDQNNLPASCGILHSLKNFSTPIGLYAAVAGSILSESVILIALLYLARLYRRKQRKPST